MSSGLDNEDILLRQAARGQSDLFPSLVEATFTRAWAVMGGNRGGLLFVYRSMRDHLDEVDSRTRFWDWFTQIAAIPRLKSSSDTTASEIPPDALAELLKSLEGPSSPRSRGLFTRLVRFHLSGWLTAFGTSMVLMLLIVFRGEGPVFDLRPAVALVPTTAIVAATISSILLGPWLSRRYQILNPLTLLPVSVASSLFVFSSLDMFADGSLNFKQAAIDGLTLLTGRDLIACALAALFVTFIGHHLTRMESWVINHSRSSWRRLLSLLAFCSLFGWTAYQIGPTVVKGWTLDPEILAANPDLYSPRLERSSDVAKTYAQHPAILRFIQLGVDAPTPSFQELESARTVWLDHVQKGWPASGSPTRSAPIAAYLTRPETSSLSSAHWGSSPQQAEVAIRIALLDQYSDPLNSREWADFSRANWQSLADLAANVEWRPPTPQVDEASVWSEFHHFAVVYEQPDPLKLQTGQSEGLGQSLINWYQIRVNRARLNEAAQTFRQVRPLFSDSKKPWSAKMEAQIQQFSWGIHHSSVWYKALYDENSRRNTAELALRLELKNLQTNGKPQPKKASDLRPPFNEIAETYAEWFSLDKLWNELTPGKP